MSLPRVTEILRTVGLGPKLSGSRASLEAARARGRAVHEYIEALHYGYEATPTPEVAPYVDAYKKFVAESGHQPIASEILVTHAAWRYCGHVDRVGWLLNHRVLLDWKTTESPDLVAASYQLAGYRLAWNEEHQSEPVLGIAVVQFKGDGTYRYHEVEAAPAERVFLAAVTVYDARREAA